MSALAGNRFPRSGYVTRSSSSGLADVLDVLLDKGLVIDAFVRVSLVGIELLTVDARIVVASVDTYLRFAEAVNRLDLTAVGEHATLPDLIGGGDGDGRGDHDREDGQQRRSLGSGGDREARGGREDGERGNEEDEEKEKEPAGASSGGGDEEEGGLLDAIGKAAQKVRERG